MIVKGGWWWRRILWYIVDRLPLPRTRCRRGCARDARSAEVDGVVLPGQDRGTKQQRPQAHWHRLHVRLFLQETVQRRQCLQRRQLVAVLRTCEEDFLLEREVPARKPGGPAPKTCSAKTCSAPVVCRRWAGRVRAVPEGVRRHPWSPSRESLQMYCPLSGGPPEIGLRLAANTCLKKTGKKGIRTLSHTVLLLLVKVKRAS